MSSGVGAGRRENASGPGGLQVGAAETRITAPVGVDLAGYAHREGPSSGVHDDLWCRALVLDDQASRVALVSLDLLGLDFPLDAALRQAVHGATGIAPGNLLLNCSHTHAGPAVVRLRSLGTPDEGYLAQLPQAVAETVAAAAGRLQPAAVAYGEAAARAGINRRERSPDGRVVIGRDPEGVADEKVRVVCFSDATGGTIGLLYHHACHGTTLGSQNRLISAEWMGAASQSLKQRAGDEAVALFLQGCAGQINPDAQERSFEAVSRLGERMAEAAWAAARSAQPISAAPLAARLTRLELPLQDPPAPASARAALARAEREAEQGRAEGLHPYHLRALRGLAAYWRDVAALAERGARGLKLPFAVQAVSMGDLALAGLSGEVFLEFAHRIEAGSPFPRTVVLGYTNGCTGYVPTPEAFAEGGYEPEDSFHYYGTLPLSPVAGDQIAARALGLLAELWEEAGHSRSG